MTHEERIQRNMYTQKEKLRARRRPLIVFSVSQIIGAIHASPLLQQPSERHSLWITTCALIVSLLDIEVINVVAVGYQYGAKHHTSLCNQGNQDGEDKTILTRYTTAVEESTVPAIIPVNVKGEVLSAYLDTGSGRNGCQ